jgi:hypothetical protein
MTWQRSAVATLVAVPLVLVARAGTAAGDTRGHGYQHAKVTSAGGTKVTPVGGPLAGRRLQASRPARCRRELLRDPWRMTSVHSMERRRSSRRAFPQARSFMCLAVQRAGMKTQSCPGEEGMMLISEVRIKTERSGVGWRRS